MLSVRYLSDEGTSHRCWYVGTGGFYEIHGFPITDIISMYANGDELDYIKQHFPTVDFPKGEFDVERLEWKSPYEVRWYGETAQFIVGNLT